MIKETKKAELFILFNTMYPSEIAKLFPEYAKCVRPYYVEYTRARFAVMRKLSLKPLAKRLLFGTNREEGRRER